MSALDRQVVIALGEQIAILKEENAALVRDLGQTRAERGAAQRQAAASYAGAEELREAAEALVAALGNIGSGAAVCTECAALAARHDEHTDQSFCDDHEFHFEVQTPMIDLPHAAPLRALRKLLGRVG